VLAGHQKAPRCAADVDLHCVDLTEGTEKDSTGQLDQALKQENGATEVNLISLA